MLGLSGCHFLSMLSILSVLEKHQFASLEKRLRKGYVFRLGLLFRLIC